MSLAVCAGACAPQRELQPISASTAFHLGRLAHTSGDVRKAVRYYELAAGSDSDVGRDAARELMKLDLEENPGRYVRVRPRLDASGHIWMVVQNGAPFAIEGIVMTVSLRDAAGGRAALGPIRLASGSRALAPGEAAQIATPLAPLADVEQLRLVQAEVEAATVAR